MSTLIAVLLALGLLSSPEGWNDLSEQEQEDMIEIVETDIVY